MPGTQKDVIQPTDREAIRLARLLVRTACYGALATLDPDDGAPMATRVALATDHDGAPVILISRLAAHTAALRVDPRCSLLVGEPGKGDPLAHPRLTLACRALALEAGTNTHERVAARYLSLQPKARLYAGFADFGFFRLEPRGASLNGGFARAYRLERDDLLLRASCLQALAKSEPEAVAHMNADHADAVAAYVRHFALRPDAEGWRLAALDPEGIDLRRGGEGLRIEFPQPLTRQDQLRPTLVAMARQARLGPASND